MFLTVHATAGVIIGQQTGNIWLAFIAGIISHIMLDIIPHGDQDLVENTTVFKHNTGFKSYEIERLKKLTLIDGVMMSGLLLIIYLAGFITAPLTVAFAVAGSIVPDFLTGVYALTNSSVLRWVFLFQNRLHYVFNGFTINMQQGVVVQAIFLIAFLGIIVFLL